MGLFGGSGDDVLPYVRELEEAAEGSTVTADALTDSRLNDPILAHLDEREQAHHVLVARDVPLRTNERGATSTVEPEGDLTTVTVLTDRRVLFVVGQWSGDVVRSVEYGDVYEFEVGTGLLRSRLDVTLRDARYTAYFSRFVDAAEVEDFLERMVGRRSPDERDDVRDSTDGVDADAQVARAGVEAGQSLPPEEIKRGLRSMDAPEFERFVAALWRARGWSATVTRESADGGIDVVATREEPFPQKHVVQAKRYAADNPVGSPQIQQYASLDRQEDGVDSVVVVTTSGFSREAEQTAENLNVKLVDGDDLAELIAEEGCHDLLAAHGASLPAHRGSERRREGDRGESAPDDARTRDESTTDDARGDGGPSAPPVRESSPDATGALNPTESTTGEQPDHLSVEDQSVIRSTEDSRGTYGSVLGHAVVAVLTAWWTVGIGNLAYASWAYHHDTYPEPDPADEPSPADEAFEAAPSANWYYGLPAGLALVILSGLLWWAGFGSIATAGLLVGWLLLPVSTYRDVQFVRAETEWNPITGWWVLGVVVLPLALVVVPLYLLRRSLAADSHGRSGGRGEGNAE